MSTEKKMKEPVSLFVSHSHQTTEANKTGSWRLLRPRYDEKTAPCSAACPAGEDIGRIEMLAARGLFQEAWETILAENPLPAVCGRLCFHPCEKKCNRREYDEGIGIRILERFLADTAIRDGWKPSLARLALQNRRIAVLGAGPAGLSAAIFFTRLGYCCEVFETAAQPGGALRQRLPEVVLNAEMERVCGEGFRLICGKAVGNDLVEEIPGDYDGVFFDCGVFPREPPEGGAGALRLVNSVIEAGRPIRAYGGEPVFKLKSVAHEVASGKEAAIAMDIIFQKGADRLAEGLEACRVGNGTSLSMEVYMRGPRAARNRHIVAFGEINTDHFTVAPRAVAPGLAREEKEAGISADLAMKEAGRCFNCGLCNGCDNCRLYCPEPAVVRERGTGGRRIDYDYCKGCGICVVECPRNAMSLGRE
jgi:Pyruvate/2-oxoacid:ferredoxin oxidoreductase delta subunit